MDVIMMVRWSGPTCKDIQLSETLCTQNHDDQSKTAMVAAADLQSLYTIRSNIIGPGVALILRLHTKPQCRLEAFGENMCNQTATPGPPARLKPFHRVGKAI